MAKEMLINTLEGHECRIAIVDEGRLQELYVERSSRASHVGNIYKGRITNIEPGIQAAFVDFGLGKNGFLHVSDVHPQHFPKGHGSSSETVGRKRPHRQRPPIQECFKRGQEVIVQMIKEDIGTKGPTLTTYLSIPGRLLVMMPGMTRLGVSRKIEDDEVRTKAKAVLAELSLPTDMGLIVRTAGIGRPKREFQRDLQYLTRLWKNVQQQIDSSAAPAELYQESDLVTRTLRDIYNTDIKRIVCDHEDDARKVQRFLHMAMPRGKHVVEVYAGQGGLFADYGLEHEIESMYARRVALPSGGSLVIDQAEALVAIDINSGKLREHRDAETTALKTDLEAAKEIARQLRVRDLGGVIVIDFIDLRQEKHVREVEKALRDAIKPDRAKTKILRMSQFGIVEMTRQRIRPSLKESIYRVCDHCDGAGVVKSEESQTIHIMRSLKNLCGNEDVATIEVTVNPTVAHHLNNIHRNQLTELETATGRQIVVRTDADMTDNDVTINCMNQRGSTVAWDRPEDKQSKRKQTPKIKTVSVEEAGQALEPSAEADGAEADEKTTAKKKKSKRKRSKKAAAKEPSPESGDKAEGAEGAVPDNAEAKPKAKKSRRRGRRGGKKAKKASTETDEVKVPEVAEFVSDLPEGIEPGQGHGAAEELHSDWPISPLVDGDEESAKD